MSRKKLNNLILLFILCCKNYYQDKKNSNESNSQCQPLKTGSSLHHSSMSDPKNKNEAKKLHDKFRNGITSILGKLTQEEKSSKDMIYYRFKAPKSEFLDNKKRAIGQPNHRYMREYFAFIERQKPYEFHSSRDLADLNPADYKSIKWVTPRPETPMSSDLSAVTEDRK